MAEIERSVSIARVQPVPAKSSTDWDPASILARGPATVRALAHAILYEIDRIDVTPIVKAHPELERELDRAPIVTGRLQRR